MIKNKKTAFTMAETLIVIAVLGIIAILTIPNLFRNQVEAQHRTKVKKSMAAYEAMFNKMVMENELRSSLAITSWADGTDNNCANISVYFKKSIDKGCTFKTSDGVWWNIANIQRPIIAFKEENLDFDKANDPDDMDAFILVGRIDDSVGTIRVDDLQFETNNPLDNSDNQVAKLFGFMNKSKNNGNNNEEPISCEDRDYLCKYMRGDFADYQECTGTRRSCYYTDTYSDRSGACNSYMPGLGSCYNRTTRRYFYYDENGTLLGEANIDYGTNDGNLSHAIFNVNGTKVYRGFYQNNKPLYDSIGGNDMPFVGYYEDNGNVGRIQFKQYGIDVIFDKNDSSSCHPRTSSYSTGGYTCDQLKTMAREELSKYGITPSF